MKHLISILCVSLISGNALAVRVAIDPTNPNNGVTDIYSRTFDGLPPLDSGSFFGVVLPLPPGRAIQISPAPTGVVSGVVPGGFTTVQNGFPPDFTLPPAPGSFLDLSLSAGNTMLTIAGGTITLPTLGLIIDEGQTSETIVLATNPGIVINPIAVTVPVDGNGVAVFEIDPPGAGIAADFSTLAAVIGPNDCAGPLCNIIPLLTLDMVKYRLIVDYDSTFSSFTADFLGQTNNFSMISATLDSSVVPIPAAAWLFGSTLGLLGWMRHKAT